MPLHPRFHLCALPALLWQPESKLDHEFRTIQELILDVRSAARRLQKGANLERERPRFVMASSQLESLCLQFAAPAATEEEFETIRRANELTPPRETARRFVFPCVTIGSRFMEALAGTRLDPRLAKAPPTIRLGAGFYAPTTPGDTDGFDTLDSHLDGFVSWVQAMGLAQDEDILRRIGFLRLVSKFRYGIVEVQDVFGASGTTMSRTPKTPPERLNLAVGSEDEAIPDASRLARMVANLHKQIREAKNGGGPINMSNHPHVVTTQVLAQMILARPGERPFDLPVIYGDGSKALPFPLHCVRPWPRSTSDPVTLRAVLMSMRHLNLDREVDFAWFRNKEVSKSRSLAESDQFCFEYSCQRLAELTAMARRRFAGRSLRLELYHTGFEPAVIGFYRALVHCLRQQDYELDLTVWPQFYKGDHVFDRGLPWPLEDDCHGMGVEGKM